MTDTPATQSLANQYRPRTFDGLLGQQPIKMFFRNSLGADPPRIRPVYLFPGMAGSGKTSAAKILARWLNCENRQGHNPCNNCPSCDHMSRGVSPNLMEVDGTSQNKLDFVENEIKPFVSHVPVGRPYKVLIVDEFHRIKDPARSSFLPLLEFLDVEHPRTVAILCTTDLEGLEKPLLTRAIRPGTFQALDPDEVASLYAAQLGLDPEVCRLILRVSDGSMRQFWASYDALREISSPITPEAVLDWAGGIPDPERRKLWTAIARRDHKKIRSLWDSWIKRGRAGFRFVAGQLLDDLTDRIVDHPDETLYVDAFRTLTTAMTFANDSRTQLDQLVLGALYSLVLPVQTSKPAQQIASLNGVINNALETVEEEKVLLTLAHTKPVNLPASNPFAALDLDP